MRNIFIYVNFFNFSEISELSKEKVAKEAEIIRLQGLISEANKEALQAALEEQKVAKDEECRRLRMQLDDLRRGHEQELHEIRLREESYKWEIQQLQQVLGHFCCFFLFLV